MKLPNRRPGVTLSIKHINSAGTEDKIIVTAGVDTETDRVMEVFVANPMVGSDMEAILTDGCILISLCLQAGISLDQLISKLGDRREHFRDQLGAPTSHFGTILRAAKQIDLDPVGGKEE